MTKIIPTLNKEEDTREGWEMLWKCWTWYETRWLYCKGLFLGGPTFRGTLTGLVPLPHCSGRSTRYFKKLHKLSATIPKCHKDVYLNSFFPHTATPSNHLHTYCIPLINDLLNGLSLRVSRQLFSLVFAK